MSSKPVVGFFHELEENGYLSNWYAAPFTLDGVRYENAEQYLMHSKAVFFGDSASAAAIMRDGDAATVKAIGRVITPYDDNAWSAARGDVIFRGLLAKFTQNPALGASLLATGDALICECAAHDRIWGVGIGMDDTRWQDASNWDGLNLLGETLMRVRAALRTEKGTEQ